MRRKVAGAPKDQIAGFEVPTHIHAARAIVGAARIALGQKQTSVTLHVRLDVYVFVCRHDAQGPEPATTTRPGAQSVVGCYRHSLAISELAPL